MTSDLRQLTSVLRSLIAGFVVALLVAGVPRGVSAQDTPPPGPLPIVQNPPPTPKPVDGETDWKNTGGTLWNTGTNWTAVTGSAPPAAGDVAWFKTAFSSGQPSVNTAVNIAGLYFSSTSSSGYSITRTSANAFTLTGYATSIGTETGDSSAVAIGATNTSGTNTIAAPIALAPASGTTSTFYQAAGGTLIVGTTGANGVISGSATLSLIGGGTFSFAGTNTYSGGTSLSGILELQSSSTVTGGVVVSGPVGTGTLTLGDGSTLRSDASTGRTLQNSIIASGSITLGATVTQTGALTFNSGSLTTPATFSLAGDTMLTTNVATTINNVLSGNFSLTKDGASALTLNAANLFTGGVVIDAGTLTLGNATALGPAANATVTFGASSTGKLQLSGNNITIVDLNTNATVGTPIIEDGSAGTHTLTVNTVNNDTYAGVLQNGPAGALALTKSGAGSLTLSGNNTYTGGTILNAGTLNINSATALGGTAGAFTINGGAIDNTTAGVLTLANNNPVTWAGDFAFGGTKDLNFGTGAVTIATDRTITLNGSGSTLTFGGTLSNTANSARTITVNGAGNTLSLGGFNLANGNASPRIDIISGSGNVNITGTVADGTGTGSSLTYSGSGKLTLGGSNTFTGGMTVISGIVDIGNNNALGTGTLTLGGTSANTPTIEASGTARTIANNVSLANVSTGNAIIGGSQDLTINGSLTGTGSSRILAINNTGTTRLSNVFLTDTATAGRTLTITGSGSVIFGGVIANNSTNNAIADNLIFNSSFIGTATINGTNTYSGTTTLSSGTFILGNKSAFGSSTIGWNGVSISASTDLSVANAIANTSTFGASGNTFTGSNNIEFSGTVSNTAGANNSTDVVTNNMSAGTLTFSGPFNLSNSTNTKTVNFNGSGNTIISGAIANGGTLGNLAYSGIGKLALSGTNTYTGTTTVNSGTLEVANDGSTTSGRIASTATITVNSSGTLLLSGSGSADRINNAAGITLNGGTLAKGSGVNEGSTSAVGMGALTLTANGSKLDFTQSAGTLTFASFAPGGSVLSITNYIGNGSPGGTDQLIFKQDEGPSGANQLSNFDFGFGAGVSVAEANLGGGFFEIYTLTPVPEPSTWSAGALALATLLFTQRRRLIRKAEMLKR